MDRTERQKLAISRWIKTGGKGTLLLSVGFGKTFTSMMLIKSFVSKNPSFSVLIGVPTEILKDQWTRELTKHKLFLNCKVLVFNTIIRNQYDVDLFILDEIHLVPTPSFIHVFETVKYKYFLGLTATWDRLDHRQVWLEQYTYICDQITLKDAVENGWLSPYRNYKVNIEVDLQEYNDFNSKFQNLFAIFDHDFKLAMDLLKHPNKIKSWAKKKFIDEKSARGYLSAWIRLLRKRKNFIQSHPKKLEIADKILDYRRDKKCITFSATIADAEHFKNRAYVLHSKRKKAENQAIIEIFNSEETGVLASAKSAQQGLDIKGLSVGINTSVNSSTITKTQILGRVTRIEEGKVAEMFTLVLKGTQDENWFYNANKDQPYIDISEKELDDVLNYTFHEKRPKTAIANLENRF